MGIGLLPPLAKENGMEGALMGPMYSPVFVGSGLEPELDYNWMEWLIHQTNFSLGGLIEVRSNARVSP